MTASESLPEFELLEVARARGRPDPADVTTRAPSPPRPPARPAVRGRPPESADALSGAAAHQDADVVAVLDEDGRLVFVSDSARWLFGVGAAELVGHDALTLFDPADAGYVRALLDDLVAGRRRQASLELRATLADGRVLDLEAVAVRRLGGPAGGVVMNIGAAAVRGRPVDEQPARHPPSGFPPSTQPTAVHPLDSNIVEALADGVMILDAAGRVAGVNESFEVMFEAPRVRIVGRRFGEMLAGARALGVELVDAEGRVIESGSLPPERALRTGRRVVGAVVGLLRQGRAPIWVQAGAQAMFDSGGQLVGAVASFSELTDVPRTAVALPNEEQFLQVLLDTLDEGIVACDAEGRITVFNPSARRLHGLPEGAEPIGEIPTDRGLRHGDGTPMAPREHPLIRAMSGERVRDVEVVLESDDGEHRKVSVNGQALVDDDGWMLGAVVAMHDVTEQRLNEERLAELALHDPLTALANRTLLAARLRAAIARMARSPGAEAETGDQEPGEPERQPGLAVLLLDLDDFKEINDQLGHDVGDDTLTAVARRLTSLVRPSDTVARLGGDEFVVVCEIEHGEEEMLRITDRISTALARPYRVDGRTLTVTASVGGVFVDNPDTDPSKLLSRADDAMYGVKWARRRQRRTSAD